jgi:hypothetical protein
MNPGWPLHHQPQIPQMTQIQFRIHQLSLNPSRRERNSAGRPVPVGILTSMRADSRTGAESRAQRSSYPRLSAFISG